jgi:hypothetical protein
MLRQQIAERRQTPLPSLTSWLDADCCQERGRLDPGRVESCAPVEAISDAIEKLPPGTQTDQSTDAAAAGFDDGRRFLATLLLQQIRPRYRLAVEVKDPSRTPAPLPRKRQRPVTTGQKASSDSAGIETLLTKLALRWLHSLAEKERP